MEQPRILVIDETAERAAILIDGLEKAGYTNVVQLPDMSDLVQRIAEVDPDAILIDLENPKRDTVEQMFRMSREVRRPIAMFVDHSDPETTARAVSAGVSAYIVDGLKPERARPVVDLAIERFKAYQALEQRAMRAEAELADRKLVERAKGILMQRRQLSEPEAYGLLRRTARDRGKRLAEVAQGIVTADDIGL